MCHILPNYTSENYQKIHYDRKEKGEQVKKTYLYYVNDSDGDTFFFLPGTKKIWERVKPKKGTMIVFNSDLEHLTRRVSRLCRTVSPPRIDMIVWHEGEDPPETKPWQLRIMIESRD